MSHFSLIVHVPASQLAEVKPGDELDAVHDYLADALDPFEERDENPSESHKWDWWKIAGRFALKLPARLGWVASPRNFSPEEEGRFDAARVGDLDAARRTAIRDERFVKYAAQFEAWIASGGEEGHPFDGPRGRALDVGLVRVAEDGVLQEGESFVGRPWGETHEHHRCTDRAGWRDVRTAVPLEAARASFDPLVPWALLVAGKWDERGRMGWFGMSSATPETCQSFAQRFDQQLAAMAPDDVLVVVDCHI